MVLGCRARRGPSRGRRISLVLDSRFRQGTTCKNAHDTTALSSGRERPSRQRFTTSCANRARLWPYWNCPTLADARGSVACSGSVAASSFGEPMFKRRQSLPRNRVVWIHFENATAPSGRLIEVL